MYMVVPYMYPLLHDEASQFFLGIGQLQELKLLFTRFNCVVLDSSGLGMEMAVLLGAQLEGKQVQIIDGVRAGVEMLQAWSRPGANMTGTY